MIEIFRSYSKTTPNDSSIFLMKSGLVIKLIACWLALSTTVIGVIALNGAPPNTRAVLLMGAGGIFLGAYRWINHV